jgi:hypothetical protein
MSFQRFIPIASFALLICAGTLHAGAAPTMTGVQYEEINRLLPSPATPPPPGSFAADVAAIESPPPDAQPKKKHGLLGAIVSGNIGDIAGDQISNSLERSLGGSFAGLTQGRVERYSYYGSWMRTDEVLAKTATIRKCDLHQTIELDLEKKTYRIIDTTPAAAGSTPVSTPAPARHTAPPSPEPPGSGLLDLTSTVRAFGTMLIDGLNTQHFQSTNSVALTQATGSCRNGSFSISQEQYFSGFAEPHAICPVDFKASAAPSYPREPSQLVARGGCRPTITQHVSGPPEPAGKLALYSLMTMSSGGAQPNAKATGESQTFSFLTERGNVHALSAVDRTLFDIPSDFTKVP